jgi:pullulanase-type alpha-1,6-glucosidase
MDIKMMRRISSKMSLVLITACAFVMVGCADKPASSGQQSIKQTLLVSEQTQSDMGAHWLQHDLILLAEKVETPFLVGSIDGEFDNTGAIDYRHEISSIDMPDWVVTRHPHLANFYAYKTEIDTNSAKSLLKRQLAVVELSSESQVNRISYVQSPIILDYLYTAGQKDADEYGQFGAYDDYGTTIFSLWAPTARKVSVHLFDKDKAPLKSEALVMQEDPKTGIWLAKTDDASQGTFYQYEIEIYHPQTQQIETVRVTDPYSLSLSVNSEFSQVVSLNSKNTMPEGWSQHAIVEVASPESMVLYETHIRDFSALDSSLSNKAVAGKYGAFSEKESDGIKHLKALHAAGLNVIHLLPTYDITTVNEDPNKVVYPNDTLDKACDLAPNLAICETDFDANQTLQNLLESTDPMTGEAQVIIETLRKIDPFNWGYDPFHYTVPEGSYAENPDGISRIVEFRQMVMSLHEMGFRVVMDVVYNHTFEAGLGKQSVLDKIVPNYYHRLHPITGAIEQSTCCDNTATEHQMMAKLMIDSLVVWAQDYKIDGFRFDLMGHQPKDAMLAARERVRLVDPDTYFYGEGWNFGEVANNARFVQATQNEMAGTEIGTFTDRLRDAVRGGSSFVSGDDIRRGQGLGNGLISMPNELQTSATNEQMMQEYMLSLDQARIGLVANLAMFPIKNAQGEQVLGRDVDYGGSPSGYALDPADIINYVSKHDNQTLWDNNQYRIASNVSTDDRVRMQLLSLAYPLMSQGIPFIHMGSELLRSKSFLRDSYDFGDWFNRVDFSKQSNNYLVGLPPADKDQANWDVITRLIKQNEGRDIVSPSHIQFASDVFMEFLRIRTSTPLFSLQEAEQIIERVSFLNTGSEQSLGLIVMSIRDDGVDDEDLDPNISELIVIFNHNSETMNLDFAGAERFALHPIQQNGIDSKIKTALANTDGFTIPGLSVAVFVR